MADVRSVLTDAMRRLDQSVDAEMLLLHALGKSRSWFIAHADDDLDIDFQTTYAALVDRRVRGEPVAYITGRRGFWSMDLEVTPDTLIPRPETELLVELALERLPRGLSAHVADLGTGSGAIALAIASARPQASVTATDASAAALAVAIGNARRLRINNVDFLEGDWLAPLIFQRFAMIVSNPPYIEAGDPHLGQGDLRFEPSSALVSGCDGLNDIRRIIEGARAHLEPDGWLLFEHGWHQGEAVRKLLDTAGYIKVFTAQDLELRDRVSGGRL